MSSIGSISGGLEASQLLQQRLRQGMTVNGAGNADSSRRADFEAKFKTAALAAGLDPTAADGLQDEIDAAVASVKNNSDSGTDSRDAVKNAIDGVLQKHGVDLEKFQTQMQQAMGGAGGPGGPGGAGGPPPGAPPGGPDQAQSESQFKEAAVAAGLDQDSADNMLSEVNSAIDDLLNNSSDSTDVRQSIQGTVDSILKKYGVDVTKFKNQLQSLAGDSTGQGAIVDEKA